MNDLESVLPCPTNVVCRCLKVTESKLLEALTAMDLKTLKEIRRRTGAGDGCNACHRVLKRYLEKHQHAYASDEPICSLK
jgi:bacterioferritin-associated ferredoxin